MVFTLLEFLGTPMAPNLSFSGSDESKDISKYKHLLESDRIDMKALRSLAWKGIPSKYRAVTWKLLLVSLLSTFQLGVSSIRP